MKPWGGGMEMTATDVASWLSSSFTAATNGGTTTISIKLPVTSTRNKIGY